MSGFLMFFYTRARKEGTYAASLWGPGCGIWGSPSSCYTAEMWLEVEDYVMSVSSVPPQAIWMVGPCIAEV